MCVRFELEVYEIEGGDFKSRNTREYSFVLRTYLYGDIPLHSGRLRQQDGGIHTEAIVAIEDGLLPPCEDRDMPCLYPGTRMSILYYRAKIEDQPEGNGGTAGKVLVEILDMREPTVRFF